MGNSDSAPAAVAVPLERSSTIDTTHIFRAASHPNELIQGFVEGPAKNSWDLFQRGVRINGDGRCIGYRVRNKQGQLGEYEWLSYNQVAELAKCVGSGLINLNCLETIFFEDEAIDACRELQLLGLFTKNRAEWFIAEQAANAYCFALVPLYDTLGGPALAFVLKQTRLQTVVVSGESFPSILQLVAEVKDTLKNIVLLDPVSDELKDKAVAAGLRLLTWNDVVEEGKVNRKPISPGGPLDVCNICYTSGTTGNPKGVVHTHLNFVSVVCASIRGQMADKEVNLGKDDLYMSYLPLAHVFERIMTNIILSVGGGIALYAGDTIKLLDDMQKAKPTVFVSVPRLFNRINDKIVSEMDNKSAMVKFLFTWGIDAKLRKLRKTGKPKFSFWDEVVFNKTKALMGGKVRFMIVGGAPLSAAVQEKISALFCCPVLEGYGLTETMGASFVNIPRGAAKGHVGGVIPAVEFMLQSVPEMGYYATDDPPKGEVCLRGPGVTLGYFQNEDLTKEVFDDAGWFHSGDVGVVLPSGALKIIDRAKSMFKLAQGEYVAPEKIEQVYTQAATVSQIFIFGYSDQPWLVGVVVPDEGVAKKWAETNKIKCTSLSDICASADFHSYVMDDMSAVATKLELKGFEKVRKIYLHPSQFSVEEQLVTPTMKLKRLNLQNAFRKEIDEMYASE